MKPQNKYHEIYLDIEKKIINGIYKTNELLPSENEMSKSYQVSRETIRKALVLLLENGYIQKQQGKGSIVLDIDRFVFPVSGLTSFKELEDQQHMKSETIVKKNEKQQISKKLARHLGVPEDTELICLERLRRIQGEVVILDYDFLLVDVVPSISDEVAAVSIYDYIENQLGLSISYAQKEITVEPVTETDKKYMDLHGDTHVVVVKSDVHLQDTTLFQYTESRHRLDKFRFVDFARRRNT